ncbi:M15 family metallopeptidase [Vibrio sp.]|uniref:M15 family metallopeptidase n=1 Tax=Vibrio sp. TaxID=678 RepID=UPI003D0A3045
MTPEQLTGLSDNHLTQFMLGEKSFAVHPAVTEDLAALSLAAQKAGFQLSIASGYRGFARQSQIWNNKMLGQTPILDADSQPLDCATLSAEEKIRAILRWSALPGASRHHWGSDFDVYDRLALPDNQRLKLEPWEYLTGHQQPFYRWLCNNIGRFGFYFPYDKDRGGVAAEPWHISHYQTGQSCLQQLSCRVLASQLKQQPVEGKQSVLNLLESIYTQFITNVNSEPL